MKRMILALTICVFMGFGCLVEGEKSPIDRKLDAILAQQQVILSEFKAARGIEESARYRNTEMNYIIMSSLKTIQDTLVPNKQNEKMQINIYITRADGGSVQAFDNVANAIEFLNRIK